MEETPSIVSVVILLMVLALVVAGLAVFIVYHIRFLIDSINNQALGSGRLLWFLFLCFCSPYADVVYLGAVWSKRPNAKPKRVGEGSG